jgi:NTP pyrophosphatase (non-canonical NTP hydrolase)
MKLQEFKDGIVERTLVELESSWDDNLHMVLGLVTEAGELADVFKKNLAYGKQIDWVNVKEELGDILWYVVSMCKINDWNPEDILQMCSDKLNTRYSSGKFSTDAANHRDLVKERNTLEGTSALVFDSITNEWIVDEDIWEENGTNNWNPYADYSDSRD